MINKHFETYPKSGSIFLHPDAHDQRLAASADQIWSARRRRRYEVGAEIYHSHMINMQRTRSGIRLRYTHTLMKFSNVHDLYAMFPRDFACILMHSD